MPEMVTKRDTPRKLQPMSPPIVPASMVRISDSQAASMKPTGSPPSGAIPVRDRKRPAMTMTIKEISASQPISATAPPAMLLSNS